MKIHLSDPDFIESLIPQKKPFVMVDELISYEPEKLLAALTVADENLFNEDGYFQAAGVLEHQAQCVALHSGYGGFLTEKPPIEGYIGSVKKFEILMLPKVGEKIISEVEIMSAVAGISLVKVKTKVNNQLMALGELMTVLRN